MSYSDLNGNRSRGVAKSDASDFGKPSHNLMQLKRLSCIRVIVFVFITPFCVEVWDKEKCAQARRLLIYLICIKMGV